MQLICLHTDGVCVEQFFYRSIAMHIHLIFDGRTFLCYYTLALLSVLK